jgi:hypothetical protein
VVVLAAAAAVVVWEEGAGRMELALEEEEEGMEGMVVGEGMAEMVGEP